MVTEQYLDVSTLSAPEPLHKALAAVDTLQAGEYLRICFDRDPVLLYPMLSLQGYDYELRNAENDKRMILIWRKGDVEVEEVIRQL